MDEDPNYKHSFELCHYFGFHSHILDIDFVVGQVPGIVLSAHEHRQEQAAKPNSPSRSRTLSGELGHCELIP